MSNADFVSDVPAFKASIFARFREWMASYLFAPSPEYDLDYFNLNEFSDLRGSILYSTARCEAIAQCGFYSDYFGSFIEVIYRSNDNKYLMLRWRGPRPDDSKSIFPYTVNEVRHFIWRHIADGNAEAFRRILTEKNIELPRESGESS